MDNLNQTLIDKIVQYCFNTYNKLPKTGKPIEKEWTVLSCIVKYEGCENIEVVSLGTGSKCIGGTKMSPAGDILNDSHAEVITRRGFLIYLYENIQKALKNEASIYECVDSSLKLKKNIKFVFYSSQLPCGDASIMPKDGETELYGDLIESSKRKAETDECDSVIKKQKITNDIHRTGAKCLPDCEQDTKEAGSNYHLLGQVRTKPGRGDQTLSVSCSDKLGIWTHLGIQGGLIHMLCEPIYISSFIFGAGVPYSEESLKRALLLRNTECLKVDVVPQFYRSSLVFANVKSEDNVRAAPGSILWVKTKSQIHEVAVIGRKLGVTKKKLTIPSNSLSISKYNLYKKFIDSLKNHKELRERICGQEQIEGIPYNVMKRKSVKYLQEKQNLKEKLFKSWTVKPDVWDFCI